MIRRVPNDSEQGCVTAASGHTPVLLEEVLAALAPRPGGQYVDGTFGGGGYALALLDAQPCTVWAIDRDPAAIERGRSLAAGREGRLHLIHGCFGEMDRLLGQSGVTAVDGVMLDIGMSSFQLADAERGFSFRLDGPLDMRMGLSGRTAADFVNELEEAELVEILFRLGEEPKAKRIARAIVAARANQPVTRTGELAAIVQRAVGRAHDGIDPATRTFQALRIAVNDELSELDRGLQAAESLLRPGGRLAVVAFHSLEDRRVKTFLRTRSGGEGRSRHLPEGGPDERRPSFSQLSRRAIKPGSAEIARNPRARSARLRTAERTDAPAWPGVGS